MRCCDLARCGVMCRYHETMRQNDDKWMVMMVGKFLSTLLTPWEGDGKSCSGPIGMRTVRNLFLWCFFKIYFQTQSSPFLTLKFHFSQWLIIETQDNSSFKMNNWYYWWCMFFVAAVPAASSPRSPPNLSPHLAHPRQGSPHLSTAGRPWLLITGGRGGLTL